MRPVFCHGTEGGESSQPLVGDAIAADLGNHCIVASASSNLKCGTFDLNPKRARPLPQAVLTWGSRPGLWPKPELETRNSKPETRRGPPLAQAVLTWGSRPGLWPKPELET